MLLQPAHLINRLMIGLLLCSFYSTAQELYPVKLNKALWHGEERTLRYHPEGGDFVIKNGNRRFNRALYGTNTAFRVEAGDLPEFAMYMPGMGGNLKLGLISGNQNLWLINAKEIIARYTPGKMSYEIHDPILGNGTLHVVVLALANAEGLILKTWYEGSARNIQLSYAFGGASGKKFSRSGDMGPDPESSFYLHPEDCKTNTYQLNGNAFSLTYGKEGKTQLSGVFPASLSLGEASQMASPSQFLQLRAIVNPVLSCVKPLVPGENQYALIKDPQTDTSASQSLPRTFAFAEVARVKIAGRIRINTPDPFINTIGGALSIASDAIWENPSYLHGAVGWRMRLNGWRGPYTADPLGWHDRAKTHFEAYSKSQALAPLTGPAIADTAFHLARGLEKMGTSMFSSGYISRDPDGKSIRPHHYDMNLVYIDGLLWHFNWTGDLTFAKQMWPVLQRHLAWEKRNFDKDDDGLYDAYAAIWASDALYYSGGAVTHSSAYNYRANLLAARIAALIGEAAAPYQQEADKILKAMNASLWMPSKGVYAEYRDALGLKSLHPSAALWTVYHSIDSDVPDAFQAYQSLRYVDQEIPHIPLKGTGLPAGDFYTLSTSNWMPYIWSINNVVMAESMHTALANWEAGRNEEGFKLFKSELLADMYMGGSPGNFVQISHYDAARGEAYRDFGDPVGISSRTVIEGLFGIVPDALHQRLTVRPGFPSSWEHAEIGTPDLEFKFRRTGSTDVYVIKPAFARPMALRLQVKANGGNISSLTVNGEKATWKNVGTAIGTPVIEINAPASAAYTVEITWEGEPFKKPSIAPAYALGDHFSIVFDPAVTILGVNDPQKIFTEVSFKGPEFKSRLTGDTGNRTAFIQLKMNGFTWWYPVCFDMLPALAFTATATQPVKNNLGFTVVNQGETPLKGQLILNGLKQELSVAAKGSSAVINPALNNLHAGTNQISFKTADGKAVSGNLINWDIQRPIAKQRSIDLQPYFNAKVTQIFKNKYLSPRPEGPTLQLPWQGIGDWPHALETANIDDSGLRKLAGIKNEITLSQGITFKTSGDTKQSNILFTSRWDNYPAEKIIPLSGKADHAYFLMAGSTNHMQSQFDNGKIIVNYTDGSTSTLILRNPETWWPIQENYYTDGFAFKLKTTAPPRLALKTGLMISGEDQGTKADQQIIDGGAATVLDLPLDGTKKLKSITLTTLANDVVIGLMSITLTQH